jgi:uncharacterized repeat protein (TIGR01451 family)
MNPQIDNSPGSFSVSQESNSIISHRLTITSTGVSPLAWSLVEMGPLVLRRDIPGGAQPAQPGDSLSTSQAPAGAETSPVGAVPIPAGPSANGVVYYADRAVFDAAYPGLPLEDFQEGSVTEPGITACDPPLDQYSDDDCFNPGDILPGIAFSDNPGPNLDGLVLLGAGFNGNSSKILSTNTYVDAFEIQFTDPYVFAAGMDLHSHYSASVVSVTTYARDGISVLDTITATATNSGAFLGLASAQPLGKIRIFSLSNQAEGIDNIAFGNLCSSAADIPWLQLSPITGTLPVGSSQDIDVTFDSTGLASGVYTGTLCVLNNSANAPVIRLPLTMTVFTDADLSVIKTAPPEVTLGDTFTYNLQVQNNGPANASAATLVDTLPAAIEFVSASPGCSQAGGVVTCDLGSLAPGASLSLEIAVRATSLTLVANTAVVSTGSPDPNNGNNASTAMTQVLPVKLYLPVLRR